MELPADKIETSVSFCTFDRAFLERSYHWLTDPEIRKLTLSPDVIRKEDQEAWFRAITGRADYKIWGVSFKDRMVGAVGLKHIDDRLKKAEYFGYIGEKEFWGRGIGSRMMEYAIGQARILGMRQLELNVAKDNTRAIALYQKYGFQMAGGVQSSQYLYTCYIKP